MSVLPSTSCRLFRKYIVSLRKWLSRIRKGIGRKRADQRLLQTTPPSSSTPNVHLGTYPPCTC